MATAMALPDETSDLQERFNKLRAASKSDPAGPNLAQRLAHLDKLEEVLLKNKENIVAAISKDFGHRSRQETLLSDVYLIVHAIRDARVQLAEWMGVESRDVHPLTPLGRAEVWAQPLGVVGIIAPWNYPIQLALSPLVGALTAGNRALIKPSELTPETSSLIVKIISEAFAEDHVTVVIGGADVGDAFSRLPFDHLFFTGSTRVGKMVMRAAAENLVPVTLELGGKSPAIVGEHSSIAKAADQIANGKLFNGGQTCVAPDYALVPKAKVDEFVAAFKAAVAKRFPTLVSNNDYTSIAHPKHFARLRGLVADAKAKGATIIEVNPANETVPEDSRKMIPCLVTSVDDSMAIMQEEIFGPILPIVPYDDLSTAIAYVNDRPRPLALYVFESRSASIDRVLSETVCGGVTVNATLMHFAQEGLPCGGVGNSGMGRYHGKDGFDALSNKKAVYRESMLNPTGVVMPPYGKKFNWLLRILLGK